MKKLMFLLAFAGIGLFANAGNGKIKKVDLVKVKMEKKEVSPKLVQWMYTVTCGGRTYTGCCWDTQAQAQFHGETAALRECY